MAPTRLSDVIVPDVWNPWVIQRTAELSALFQSGIISPVPELESVQSEGGNTVNLPFWNDLDGDDEVLSATGGQLTVNPITSGQDKAVVLFRGKAWGTNELAAQLSGGDPAGAIADLVAAYWARRIQAAAISVITGVFDSMLAEAIPINVLDISGETGSAAVISAETLLDAQQLLGDAKGRLSAIAMHSETENKLVKLGIIDFIQEQDVGPRMPVYQDKRVIVDDGMPVTIDSQGMGDDNVYDTILFGPGALGYANISNSKITLTEVDRDASRGEDQLYNRRMFILHPRGVAWAGTATGGGPTNAQLADPDNWERVYEPKNVRMVLLRHRLS